MNWSLHSSVFFLLVVLPSGQASPTPAGDASPTPPCASCVLADRRNTSAPLVEQIDMVEAVKRHILNMLHLSARPNLTHPVPRVALLNALKKLHLEIQDQEPEQEPEPPSEIITFAEPGASPTTVTFDLSKEGTSSSMVEQANVWIFLKLAKGIRAKGKVNLRLLQHRASQTDPSRAKEEETVSEKMIDAHQSGWHTLPLPRTVQALLESGESLLNLRVSCPLCAEAGATPILVPAEGEQAKEREQSHRPFLMVGLRAREDAAHRRTKRALECDGKIRACCKRQFYVNFKDIGWNDWIIAPSGYHANYCEGDCTGHAANVPGSSLSFHSTVISHYRMRGYAPFQNAKSCCVPTRLRAMSMLYYNEEQKIIKKDIQNMIVEECGCS